MFSTKTASQPKEVIETQLTHATSIGIAGLGLLGSLVAPGCAKFLPETPKPHEPVTSRFEEKAKELGILLGTGEEAGSKRAEYRVRVGWLNLDRDAIGAMELWATNNAHIMKHLHNQDLEKARAIIDLQLEALDGGAPSPNLAKGRLIFSDGMVKLGSAVHRAKAELKALDQNIRWLDVHGAAGAEPRSPAEIDAKQAEVESGREQVFVQMEVVKERFERLTHDLLKVARHADFLGRLQSAQFELDEGSRRGQVIDYDLPSIIDGANIVEYVAGAPVRSEDCGFRVAVGGSNAVIYYYPPESVCISNCTTINMGAAINMDRSQD